MASPVAAKEHSNTKSEEGTTAFHKKRSRRVSFAESTSVHIFDRDEEIETPPDPDSPSSPNENLGFSDRDGEPTQLFGNEEDDEDEDMNELRPRSPFFRVVRSPSSGGSTIGSATSNDDDKFFGPVSEKFIRWGFSDSAASDENHDHTMDSTAFSMNFRSIARSDSEADMSTPTGVQTPTPSAIPSNTRNPMLLTPDKKPFCQSDVSTSQLRTGSESDDMSLVGTYHDKYDYGKLSPASDALNDLHVVLGNFVLKSPLKSTKQSKKESGCDLMDFSYGEDSKMQGYKPLSPNQSNRGTLTVNTKQPDKDEFDINSRLKFLAASKGTPTLKNTVCQLDDVMEKENKSPFVGSIIHFNGDIPSKSPGTVTSSHNQASIPRTENLKHGGSLSSLQKSISKLRNPEAFPFSRALIAKLQESNSESLVGLEKNNKSPQPNYMNNIVTEIETLNTYLEGHNESETRGDLTNLSNDKEGEKVSIFTASDIPMGQIKASILLNRRHESTYQKNLADQFGKSPVNKEVLQNDRIDLNRVEPSAERKRKTKDMMTEKISRIKWSSSDSGLSRFFIETKLHDMNLHTIDRLVDIVGQLQKSKTYELLSSEIQSQATLDPGSNIREKRKAEIKQLLCKTMYEKAKLQLMHAKQERLQKNRQSLVSGFQESEALKLKYSSQNLLNAQVIHHQAFSDNEKDIQEYNLLRQAVKDTDSKITNLVESFHELCNMKETDPAETTAFVKNHLMKKVQCQIIRKNMQIWVVDELKSSKDHHVLVLNYLDLMTQRFFIYSKYIAITYISVSNILNETNILKNFKDLDALTAFRFVFDGGLTKKNVNLAHETQMTSSLLGNLVDVIEEIQVARFELKNLVCARFCTSSDEHLYLELYFFDSTSRKKAAITLNISCLKRGIYPSEVSSSSSLSPEITASVKDLRVGFLRILRLCRCISQVVGRSR